MRSLGFRLTKTTINKFFIMNKHYFFRVNRKKFEVSTSTIKGRDILSLLNLQPINDFEILQKINEKGYEPIDYDEGVNLDKAGIESFRVRPYRKICILIDDKEVCLEDCLLTISELMDIAGIDKSKFYLKEDRKGIEVSYENDINHMVNISSKSKFYTCPISLNFDIIVNSKDKVWNKDKITFIEIITLAKGTFNPDPKVRYTVTYKRGPVENPQGSMIREDIVCVANKMIFNVRQSNKS